MNLCISIRHLCLPSFPFLFEKEKEEEEEEEKWIKLKPDLYRNVNTYQDLFLGCRYNKEMPHLILIPISTREYGINHIMAEILKNNGERTKVQINEYTEGYWVTVDLACRVARTIDETILSKYVNQGNSECEFRGDISDIEG